jgi:hypothetical protein
MALIPQWAEKAGKTAVQTPPGNGFAGSALRTALQALQRIKIPL